MQVLNTARFLCEIKKNVDIFYIAQQACCIWHTRPYVEQEDTRISKRGHRSADIEARENEARRTKRMDNEAQDIEARANEAQAAIGGVLLFTVNTVKFACAN